MIKKRIINIVSKACALEEKVTEESELKLLSLDSLSFIEVLIDIEEEFEITFDVEELGFYNWETVSDIVNSVEEKINGKK